MYLGQAIRRISAALRGAPGQRAPVARSLRAHRRRLLADTALTNHIHFETLENRLLLSADILPIQGSIDLPGEQDRFVFTLTDEKRVYFDSQTASSAFRWSLDGPGGAEVANRPFDQSDGWRDSGDPVLKLAPGDYTLTVDGSGDTTGDYQFRLLNIDDAEQVTVGDAVSGALDPGAETDIYKFDAEAGQRLFVDLLSRSGDYPDWTLLDPFDRAIFSQGITSNLEPVDIAVDGTYTLLIEGDVYNSTTQYSFRVGEVTETGSAISIGDVVTGAIDQPGQAPKHTFEVSQDTLLYLDALAGDGNMQWSLTGPHGAEVSARPLTGENDYSHDPLLRLAPGSYTLTVDASGDTVGPYAFRLVDASAEAAALTPGTTEAIDLGDQGSAAALSRSEDVPALAGVSDPGAERSLRPYEELPTTVADDAALNPDAITVEAWVKANDSTYGASVLIKSNYDYYYGGDGGYGLYSPDGNTIAFFLGDPGNRAEADLPIGVWTHVAGTYDGATLKIYINGALANSLEIADALTDSPAPLVLGNGSQSYYSPFSAWNGLIDEVRIWDKARDQSAIAADYDAKLSGNETDLIAYWSFDEENGATAADLAGGHDGVLADPPARETKFYTFSGAADDRFFLDTDQVSGYNYVLRIFDPRGHLFRGPNDQGDGFGVFTLPADGDYLVAVESLSYAGDISLALTLHEVADKTAALSLDTVTTASIDAPGQVVRYAFSLAGTTSVVFDPLDPTNYGNWSLSGPDGTVFDFARCVEFAVRLLRLLAADGTRRRQLHPDRQRFRRLHRRSRLCGQDALRRRCAGARQPDQRHPVARRHDQAVQPDSERWRPVQPGAVLERLERRRLDAVRARRQHGLRVDHR